MQCRRWWRELKRRCPICLEVLRLPMTEGAADRVLLSPLCIESVTVDQVNVAVEELLGTHEPQSR